MIPAKEKQKIVEKFKTHETDTGSADVQIAVLTEEIKRLSDHLKTHRKDNHSRRGLLKMVSKRKSLIDYLTRENPKRAIAVAKKLGLRSKAS